MRYAADKVEKRLWLFSGQIYSSSRLGAWCFNAKKKMFYSTDPNWQEFQMFLQISGILDAITSEVCDDPEPAVYTDDLGMLWIAERVNQKDQSALFIVCGPAYIQEHSKEEVLERLSSLDLSVSLRIKYASHLSIIPVLSSDMIGSVSRMLHFTIYDEYLPQDFVKFAQPKEPEKPEPISGDEAGIPQISGMEKDYGGNAVVQKILLDSVRNGRYEENSEETGPSHRGVLQNYGIKDELRTVKNNMIIFISRCCDAAIEGGLPARTAVEKQNQAIKKLEQCRSIAEAANVNWDNFLGFVNAVHETKQAADTGISKPVQQIMDYIQSNYQKTVSLSELARLAGYSEYYLSRKFTRETGMKIQDYLKQARMNMAKVMLTTSQKSIFQIAEELQFKSRSHFDKNFSQFTGMSPAQYRESMGKAEE